MSTRLLMRFGAVAIAAATIGSMAACDFNRASVLDPIGDPSYDFQLSGDGRNIPGGSAATSTGSQTVTLTLRGLEPLTSGVYQVWLGTAVAGANPGDTATVTDWTPAIGTRKAVRTDTTFTSAGDPVATPTTVDSTAGVSSFTQGGPATVVTFTIDAASLGQDPTQFNVVLVSLESATGAATPGTARPLWARGVDSDGSHTVRFGNFRTESSLEYRFTSTGRGRGGIRGNVLIVDDSALARPPVGYYYATWVVKRSDGAPVDTLDLGPQTAPYPNRDISLLDADISNPSSVVLDSPMEILAAANRMVLSSSDALLGFEDVWVTLENKFGASDTAAPSIVLSGTIPTVVSAP